MSYDSEKSNILIVQIDLWDFPKNLQTSSIADQVETNFFQRCPPEQRPAFLRANDTLSPPSFKDTDIDSISEGVGHRKKEKPVYDSSLMKALNQTFFYRWWFAGLLKFGSGTSF